MKRYITSVSSRWHRLQTACSKFCMADLSHSANASRSRSSSGLSWPWSCRGRSRKLVSRVSSSSSAAPTMPQVLLAVDGLVLEELLSGDTGCSLTDSGWTAAGSASSVSAWSRSSSIGEMSLAVTPTFPFLYNVQIEKFTR